jgi:hypothetical protein
VDRGAFDPLGHIGSKGMMNDPWRGTVRASGQERNRGVATMARRSSVATLSADKHYARRIHAVASDARLGPSAGHRNALRGALSLEPLHQRRNVPAGRVERGQVANALPLGATLSATRSARSGFGLG